ncbi:MAG: hypothetical protein LBQ24_07495 [Candidatus Peribacteria bacterium]|nr:hypothetical protein [Candidatus Peribacteria bacterium]
MSYTPTNAYDSVQGNIPHYWNDNNLWDKSNLKDNATTYGSANSTIFLYNSSANTDKWARFTVDLGVEKFVRDVDIYVAG